MSQPREGGRGLIPARAGSTGRIHRENAGAGAHPRPCGEHDFHERSGHGDQGSSPPVRGAHGYGKSSLSGLGLIPARAGSTRLVRVGCPGSRAHPRPCGEHSKSYQVLPGTVGSSPPVRGAHTGALQESQMAGLIPARAGSTESSRATRSWHRAHPRPCGEHLCSLLVLRLLLGSSPPVRGARYRGARPYYTPGLIPARAGSTGTRLFCACGKWAHPRPCGEHYVDISSYNSVSGSSPPVRGARGRGFFNLGALGLIPARAGSTPGTLRSWNASWAHPRPCGEHSLNLPLLNLALGSSPPVRGAHCNHSTRLCGVGLIPARAGSTFQISPHPSGTDGSSPPVRGALCSERAASMAHGLIPARAGSTARVPVPCAGIWAHPRPCGEHSRPEPARTA